MCVFMCMCVWVVWDAYYVPSHCSRQALARCPTINGHLVLGEFIPADTVDMGCLVAMERDEKAVGGKVRLLSTVKQPFPAATPGRTHLPPHAPSDTQSSMVVAALGPRPQNHSCASSVEA